LPESDSHGLPQCVARSLVSGTEDMVRRVWQALIVGAGAAAVALILWTAGFLDLWEFAVWRWRVDFFAGPGAATSRIKLILLDQKSLDWAQKENGWSWPWPREVYTPIIDFCVRSGAKAVVFDMLFTEPSVYGVDDDRKFGAAISRTPVFVAPLFLGKKSGNAKTWPSEIPETFPLKIANLDEWLAGLSPGSMKDLVIPEAKFPVPEVYMNSTVLGSVTQGPDFDGIFRRYQLFNVYDDHVISSLSLAAFLAGETAEISRSHPSAHSEITVSRKEMRIRDDCLQAAGRCIPMDAHGKAVLRFRGPSETYGTFSAAAVIQSELRLRRGEKPVIENPSIFKDCYVLLGASAPGLLDLRPTPISKVSPGVELHATMLDNLMSGDFLRETPKWFCFVTTLSLALLSIGLVVAGRGAWQSALAVGIFLPLPWLIGLLAYPLGYWWPVMVHGVATAVAVTGGVFLNYANEGRQKSFIKKAFKYYLNPEVIDRILKDPAKLRLGGERRELSILFSDLKGFSSISEKLDPQTLTDLLNEYLSDMTDIILDEGGTLDKYEGDAIIAFWNAPLDQPDHARRACRAAIRCQLRLEARRDEFLERTGALLHARIGIHTGQVVVGNMGSKKRFNYTIFGDAANLASRLEGANKVFGTRTMVSETTWSGTEGEFLGREIGLIRVVGREAPVRVFELIGLPGDRPRRGMEKFREALALYYARDLPGALGIFRNLPDDPVAAAYANHCENLLNEPVTSWDGVWNLKDK
jgi:adenylate cyclase